MRPSASNSTMAVPGAADFKNFHSPIPYLFSGLGLMVALIAASLLILACSYRKRYSSSAPAGDEEKPQKTVDVEVSSEPKIVVIMAGESNPTYLAKPVSSTSHTQQAI